MCGICGILYYDPSRQVQTSLIESMNHIQHHRGPDDTGVWVKDNIGLGQARLAIIDLSSQAHQPMSNEDMTVWITYNGEIYNFLDLRQSLIQKGHKFHSQSDSEVILHLWEEKGPRLVEDLRGMFAICLWDDKEKVLFLARDRMGKKPLFYADLPDRVVFGSEIKAILKDPEYHPQPDLQAIHYYLAYQSVPAPHSAFKDIKKLPPAHYALVKDGHILLYRYWKLSYQEKFQVDTETKKLNLTEDLLDHLGEAIRIRLISDVPLGAYLSGGVDSSLIVALMSEMINQPVKTFSIGFREREFNELPYAEMVAKKYKTDHHEFIVTPEANTIIPKLVWHYNEPFADSSAIPTFYISKLARQHVTVVLTGDGGDENFAGYPRYQFKRTNEIRTGFMARMEQMQKHASDLKPYHGRGGRIWNELLRLKNLTHQRLQYYYRITHFNEAMQQFLCTREFLNSLNGVYAVDIMLSKIHLLAADDPIDEMTGIDLNLYLPDTLMTKTDIAGMANSLEARMPFLDHKFLEFTARIPSEFKLKDQVISKYLLKKAGEAYLSSEILHREKMGFAVPLEHWFRFELKEMAYDLLLSKHTLDRGYFQRWYIEYILERHSAGENWSNWIWNLVMLELWHRMFIDQKTQQAID